MTDLNRNTKEHVEPLKKTGKPEVLTVNGQAEVVVVHVRHAKRRAVGEPDTDEMR